MSFSSNHCVESMDSMSNNKLSTINISDDSCIVEGDDDDMSSFNNNDDDDDGDEIVKAVNYSYEDVDNEDDDSVDVNGIEFDN